MAPGERVAPELPQPGGGSSREGQSSLQGAAGRRQAGVEETLQEAWPGYEPGGALGADYWCCPRWGFA